MWPSRADSAATSGRTDVPSPSAPRLEAIALAVGALAFAGLVELATRKEPHPLDVAITVRLQRRHSAIFRRVMQLISAPGYAPFTHSVVLTTASTLWSLGRRRAAVFAIGTMGAGFTTGVIKLFVGRPRPDHRFRRHQRQFKDNSFPSGHATHYTAYYGYIFFLAARSLPSSPLRAAIMAYCATLIAFVGPSRVYLGHHWASDVAAGQLVGFTYLMALLEVYDLFDPMRYRLERRGTFTTEAQRHTGSMEKMEKH